MVPFSPFSSFWEGLRYDWFKTGATPNNKTSHPDPSANNTNSAYLIRDAAKDFLARQTTATPWFLCVCPPPLSAGLHVPCPTTAHLLGMAQIFLAIAAITAAPSD